MNETKNTVEVSMEYEIEPNDENNVNLHAIDGRRTINSDKMGHINNSPKNCSQNNTDKIYYPNTTISKHNTTKEIGKDENHDNNIPNERVEYKPNLNSENEKKLKMNIT